MKDKKEIDKKYKGFRYLVLGLTMGHRCGYVEIPKGHKLYGLSYSEQLPITFKEISKQKIGKRGIVPIFCAGPLKEEDRICMDLLFDVHGGITFSGELRDFKGYWIGFDCAHSGDAKDFSLMGEKEKEIWKDFSIRDFGEVIRTTDYVEKECKSLINQIIKYFKP